MALTIETALASQPPAGTISTSLQTSVTYDNVTFNFGSAVPVGRFEAGIKDGAGNYAPFVLSTTAFTITSITPASSGDANGTVKDPWTDGDQQGWDIQIQNQVGWSGNQPLDYIDSLNVDPGNTGSPISVSQGANTTYVKGVRVSGATTATWQQIDRYVPLTVLSAAPVTGAFRPPMSQVNTKPIFTINDLNTNSYRLLDFSGMTVLPSYSAMRAVMPPTLGQFGENSIQRRWLRTSSNLGAPGGGNPSEGYSSDINFNYGQYAVRLFDDSITAAQREEIIGRICQWAIDIYGLYNRGWSGLGGARSGGSGQHGGWHFTLYMAAHLLNNSSLLAAAQVLHSHIDGKFWQAASDLDVVIRADGSFSKNFAIFPHWEENIGFPHMWAETPSGQVWQSYIGEDAGIHAWEMVCICGMKDGPGGRSGSESYLEVAAGQIESAIGDTTNFKSAGLAYLDRMRKWSTQMTPADAFWLKSNWFEIYDAILADEGRSIWQGVPDPLEYSKGSANGGVLNNDMFSASGNGAIAYTTSGRNQTTSTITQYDARLSMDGGVQFKEYLDLGASSGTISGLIHGQEYYCQLRRQSATGPSAWSVNLPTQDTDGFLPGVVTTGDGSPANSAPANVDPPVIMFDKYPVWVNDKFWAEEDASPTVITAEHIELALGGGFWTGYPAPTLSYLYEVSDTGTGGWSTLNTTQFLTRSASIAGKYGRGTVTATNSSGSVQIQSQIVRFRDITALGAGVLVDTEFDGLSVVDYETQLANVTATGGTVEHQYGSPTNPQDGYPDVSLGRLRLRKSGSSPVLTFPLKGTAVAGTTYSFIIDIAAIAAASFTSMSGTTYTTSISNASGQTFWSDTFSGGGGTGTTYTKRFTGTFAVGGGVTDLNFLLKVGNNNASGNAAGGDPTFCKAYVAAV